MTTALSSAAPDLSKDDYLVVGLATCFVKENGEIREVQIVEPVPSAALEAIIKGIPTSYKMALATTIGAILDGDTPKMPPQFPAEAQFGDEFAFRAIAATRTYKSRPIAREHIPLGTIRQDFKYSLERKRILNSKRQVRTEDNVKQHEYTHKVL